MTEGTRTHCIWQPTEKGKYALTEAIVFPSVVLHNHSLPVLVSHKSQPSACSWHEKTAVSGLLFYSCSQILDAHASLNVTFLKQWCLSICLIFPTAYICLHLTSVCRAHVEEKFWSQDIFSKCTTSGIVLLKELPLLPNSSSYSSLVAMKANSFALVGSAPIDW